MVGLLQVAPLIGALARHMASAAQWQCGGCCSVCFPLIVSPARVLDMIYKVAKIEEWIATLQFTCAELLQLW